MAIVEAKFYKTKARMKAAVRYIEHRSGRDGQKVTRELYGMDGSMDRQQAYQMIDEAGKGTAYFRFIISPHPTTEDTEKDLHLAELTRQTMLTLEEQLKKEVPYIAAEHDDHAPHRHIHVLALVHGRLNVPDLQAMRQTATQSAQFQRQERDQAREQQQQAQQQKGAQWAL
jgi:hypothetical protein